MVPKFASSIIKKVLNSNSLNSFVLQNTDLQRIRKFCGNDFLSPIQQFAADGYNNVLFENLDISEDGVVVVLGGYLGDSASNYSNTLKCNVYVYEPIEEFFQILRSRFIEFEKMSVFNYAIHSSDGRINMRIDGEKTGHFNNSHSVVQVECKDISSIVKQLGMVDLLESNIEGGEYAVFKRLIETEEIVKIRYINVQFHNYNISNEVERSKIRLGLSRTHRLVFNYEWVWERWELRSD